MTFGSLFAGIGGFDLGFDRAGMQCLWQVEKDDWCRSILAKHWPHVERYEDVRDVGKHNLRTVDVICGGFPCPAFSRSGKEGGFEQDDLFFQITRIAQDLQPKFIVFENVKGFTRWREVLHKEVEDIGYEWCDMVLDARDFGIPQARERYFAICVQRGMLSCSQHLWGIQREKGSGIYGIQPNAQDSQGWWTPTIRSKEGWRTIFSAARRCGTSDGIPNRMDRIRGLGNAVVPQIAEYIGQCLMAHNRAHRA